MNRHRWIIVFWVGCFMRDEFHVRVLGVWGRVGIFSSIFILTWSFELLGIKYEVLSLRFWLIELVVCGSLIAVLCLSTVQLRTVRFQYGFKRWLGTDFDFIDKLCLLTVSSTNGSSIWATFNFSLASATAFNVSPSSNSCFFLSFLTFF